MTAFLFPRNWQSFQHYGKRRPPWIKLHKSLLDNYDFHRLSDASKALAPMLWLLASEFDDGQIPLDFEMLEFRLRLRPDSFVKAFSQLVEHRFFDANIDAKKMLAAVHQHASALPCSDASNELSSSASASLFSEEKRREEEREREEPHARTHEPPSIDDEHKSLAGAPPIRDLVRDPPPTAGAWAVELRRRSVSITSQHPTLCAWIADGISLDLVLEALEIARQRKPKPGLIAANYLDAIVRDQTATKTDKPPGSGSRAPSLAEIAARSERMLASGAVDA